LALLKLVYDDINVSKLLFGIIMEFFLDFIIIYGWLYDNQLERNNLYIELSVLFINTLCDYQNIQKGIKKIKKIEIYSKI
jgi:hypothetical protein